MIVKELDLIPLAFHESSQIGGLGVGATSVGNRVEQFVNARTIPFTAFASVLIQADQTSRRVTRGKVNWCKLNSIDTWGFDGPISKVAGFD